jgi:hypothetical protein
MVVGFGAGTRNTGLSVRGSVPIRSDVILVEQIFCGRLDRGLRGKGADYLQQLTPAARKSAAAFEKFATAADDWAECCEAEPLPSVTCLSAAFGGAKIARS